MSEIISEGSVNIPQTNDGETGSSAVFGVYFYGEKTMLSICYLIFGCKFSWMMSKNGMFVKCFWSLDLEDFCFFC